MGTGTGKEPMVLRAPNHSHRNCGGGRDASTWRSKRGARQERDTHRGCSVEVTGEEADGRQRSEERN